MNHRNFLLTCGAALASPMVPPTVAHTKMVVPPSHPLAGEPGVVVDQPLPESMP